MFLVPQNQIQLESLKVMSCVSRGLDLILNPWPVSLSIDLYVKQPQECWDAGALGFVYSHVSLVTAALQVMSVGSSVSLKHVNCYLLFQSAATLQWNWLFPTVLLPGYTLIIWNSEVCAAQSVSAHISSKPTAMRPLTAIYGHHKELFSVGKMPTFVTQMV